jgi:hypothetical protein
MPETEEAGPSGKCSRIVLGRNRKIRTKVSIHLTFIFRHKSITNAYDSRNINSTWSWTWCEEGFNPEKRIRAG